MLFKILVKIFSNGKNGIRKPNEKHGGDVMKKFSSICILVLIVITCKVNSAPAYDEDQKIILRITNLLNIYEKKMILRQIIGNSGYFSINVNNRLSRSPHALKAIDDDYIDEHSIYYDMTRYNITIDKLEKKLIIDATPAYNKNGKIISRIANLINTYGKEMILHQILGKDYDNFTINFNNKLCDTHVPLQCLGETNVNVNSIYYDMARYKITIDELEKRLKIEASRIKKETEALEKERLVEAAKIKAELEKKRLAKEKAEAERLEIERLEIERLEAEAARIRAELVKKRLAEKESLSESSQVVGIWEDNFLNGTITIFRHENGLFFDEVFYNKDKGFNSKLKRRLVEKNIYGKKRLIYESPTGDYFIIKEDGNLGIYDEEGLISIAIKKTIKQNYNSKSKLNTYSQEECLTNFHYATMVIPIMASINVGGMFGMHFKLLGGLSSAIESSKDILELSVKHNKLSGLADRQNKYKNDIERLLKNLNACLNIKPEARKKLADLFGAYSQLHSLALSPSGSLFYLKNKVNELYSKIVAISNEIDVLLPLDDEEIKKPVAVLLEKFMREHMIFLEQTKEKRANATQQMVELGKKLL